MIKATENKQFIYEFGKFVLDPQERVLFADGKPVHLADKVFDTLWLLVQHNGRLLTKDEMMDSIWEESFVEEGNLAKNVSRLRKILNTGGASLIETLPKRGYRFQADVREIDGATSLLIHRNLRVKITRTAEDDAQLKPYADAEILLLPKVETLKIQKPLSVISQPRKKILLTALGVLSVLIISTSGFYLWKGEQSVVNNETGAVRLTDNPKSETHPQWTNDGRIRFIQYGSDRRSESLIMNTDGTNQIAVKDFDNLTYGFWSPDDTKIIYAKRNDKTAYYLADANGGGEIALPFFAGNFDWSPDSRQIVYQKKISDTDPDIFVYSLDTGKSANITNNPAFDADPNFAPDGKQIVFVSLRDGNVEIYLMNSDGGDVRRLTAHPAWDSHPVFSPDGTTIAFDSNRESENTDVYLMNTDGGDVRRLTDWQTEEYVEPGCWSPDGTKIAFVSDRDGSEDIFVTGAEIDRPRLVLADEKSNLQHPSVSPDGKQIAFQAEAENKSGELRVFDVETGQSRVLLKTANADIAPVFSPDGTRIAFQNKIEANTEICLIKSDGSELTNLTDNAARDGNPAWSPDGRQIVFASNRDGNYGVFNLFVMNADGGNPHQIYSNKDGMSVSPAWSPDGRDIVFANDKEDGATGNFEIFKIRLESVEAAQRLTFRRRYDTYPAFSPDGKRIVFVSNTDGNSEIYIENSDGTGLVRVTRNQAEDGAPQFFKDGKSIIFSSNRDGKYAIYEISINE